MPKPGLEQRRYQEGVELKRRLRAVAGDLVIDRVSTQAYERTITLSWVDFGRILDRLESGSGRIGRPG